MKRSRLLPPSPEALDLRQHTLQQPFERVHLLGEPLVTGIRQQTVPRFLQILAHGLRYAFQVRDLLRDGAFVVVHGNVRRTGTLGCNGSASRSEQPHWRALIGAIMDITTILILVVIILLLGGGWYGRGRWF
jgi:hypothetical protein